MLPDISGSRREQGAELILCCCNFRQQHAALVGMEHTFSQESIVLVGMEHSCTQRDLNASPLMHGHVCEYDHSLVPVLQVRTITVYGAS